MEPSNPCLLADTEALSLEITLLRKARLHQKAPLSSRWLMTVQDGLLMITTANGYIINFNPQWQLPLHIINIMDEAIDHWIRIGNQQLSTALAFCALLKEKIIDFALSANTVGHPIDRLSETAEQLLNRFLVRWEHQAWDNIVTNNQSILRAYMLNFWSPS